MRSRLIGAVVAAAALVVLCVSTAPRLDDVWIAARSERQRWEHVPETERSSTYVTSIPLPVEIFDFYSAYLRPGDRYYIQIPPGAFSAFADKPGIVRTTGRLRLVPAIEVEDPDQADVILSWDADPGVLPYRYVEQHRAGLQLLFVSRIDR